MTEIKPPDSLSQQFAFLREVDGLKKIERKTGLFDGSRVENVAEHCWQISLAALLFAEYANEKVNIERVIRMLLIHDVVEVDVGDTFHYEKDSRANLQIEEDKAATRIFGMLPQSQGEELLALWREFDARQTADAKFAASIDRVLPILQNAAAKGGSWLLPGIHAGLVLQKCAYIAEGSTRLWDHAKELIARSVAEGFLAPDPTKKE